MAFCWRLVSIAIIGVGTALLLDTHIPINKKGQWAGIKDMAFLSISCQDERYDCFLLSASKILQQDP
jgi:hypothetical protein